jgi:hypothetical protein
MLVKLVPFVGCICYNNVKSQPTLPYVHITATCMLCFSAHGSPRYCESGPSCTENPNSRLGSLGSMWLKTSRRSLPPSAPIGQSLRGFHPSELQCVMHLNIVTCPYLHNNETLALFWWHMLSQSFSWPLMIFPDRQLFLTTLFTMHRPHQILPKQVNV